MTRILVCPVCKSTDLDLDAGGYTGKYKCKKCGYVGFAIEMTEGEYKEMLESEEIKKKDERREHKPDVRPY
jgi:transposase-like protein